MMTRVRSFEKIGNCAYDNTLTKNATGKEKHPQIIGSWWKSMHYHAMLNQVKLTWIILSSYNGSVHTWIREDRLNTTTAQNNLSEKSIIIFPTAEHISTWLVCKYIIFSVIKTSRIFFSKMSDLVVLLLQFLLILIDADDDWAVVCDTHCY